MKKLEAERIQHGGFCGSWISGGETIVSTSLIDGMELASVLEVSEHSAKVCLSLINKVGDLKRNIRHFEDSQEWHSTALEKLGPLRYHINILLEHMESHNRYAKRSGTPGLSKDKILEAKKALENAEMFFSA